MAHLRIALVVTLLVAGLPAQNLKTLESRVREAYDTGGYPSLAVAIVQNDRVVTTSVHGFADRESRRRATRATLYRIGSVSKVLTTTLLVQLRDKGLVRLDDPISKYLPAEVTVPSDPRGARAITLRHLATHASGLPRNPVNLRGTTGDPWNGYRVSDLYLGLRKTRLEFPTGASGLYSNLGFGLLGHVLGLASGSNYEAALMRHVTQPMGMASTRVSLSPAQRARLATPYGAADTTVRVKDWDMGTLAGAGGVASTIDDMARFLTINMQSGRADAAPIAGGSLTELHTPQRIWDDWTKATALAWIVDHTKEMGDIVWHNGGMAGYRSWIGFSPRWKVGVVVLTNCGRSVDEIGAKLLKSSLQDLRTLSPRFRTAAESLVPHFKAKPDDTLGDLFDEGFLEQVPLPIVKNVFVGLFDKYGSCKRVDTVRTSTRPELAEVVFVFEKGVDLVTCQLGIDEKTGKIVYLRF